MEVVLAHLEAARTVAHHGGLYHTNAEVKLQGEFPGHILGTRPSLVLWPLLSPFLQMSIPISPPLFPALFP